MLQIFHIFQKDCRRHWPEVLVALLLLGLYARFNANPWHEESRTFLFGRFTSVREWLAPIMILFWIFLSLRIIHGEPLVGDRQWWLTKPYVWWKLLLSKLLFIVVVILVPLLFIQLYFLYRAGFPAARNFPAILNMQGGLLLSLFLATFVLGSITKGLGQAVTVIAAIIVASLMTAWLASDSGVNEMTVPRASYVDLSQYFCMAALLAVLLWQFARRKTWQSWLALPVLTGITIALAVFIPGNGSVEAAYPLVDTDSPTPVRLSLETTKLGGNSRWPTSIKYVLLQVPVSVSGIAEKTAVQLEGIKVTLTAPDQSTWTGGWQAAYHELWPGEQSTSVNYSMKRADFDHWK